MRKSFLLAQAAFLYPKSSEKSFYDPIVEVNMFIWNGVKTPTVSLRDKLNTVSKTFAAPGDDDPDREAEVCY
jgi:hypothetical protein